MGKNYKGTINERKSGNHTARFDKPPEARDSDERDRINKTFETKKEAENWLMEMTLKYNTGDVFTPSEQTLKQLLTQWFDHKKGDVKKQTWTNYRQVANDHIIPTIGHQKIKNLSPVMIQNYVDNKKQNNSASYLTEHRAVLNQALTWATKMGSIQQNPMEGVEFPTQQSKPKKFYNLSQLSTYLKAADDLNIKLKNSNKEPPIWSPVASHLLVTTALRVGELCGLTWDTLDLDHAELRVSQQFRRHQQMGLHFTSPKNENSRRTLSIDTHVITKLKRYKKIQHRKRMKIGEGWSDHYEMQEKLSEHNMVFTDADGEPMTPDKLRHYHKKTIDEADLPAVDLHSFRHSKVSILDRKGRGIKEIASRLGHSVKTALQTYAHIFDGQDEETAKIYADEIYNHESRSG